MRDRISLNVPIIYVNALNDGCLAMSEGTADMISRVQGRNQTHNFHNGVRCSNHWASSVTHYQETFIYIQVNSFPL